MKTFNQYKKTSDFRLYKKAVLLALAMHFIDADAFCNVTADNIDSIVYTYQGDSLQYVLFLIELYYDYDIATFTYLAKDFVSIELI